MEAALGYARVGLPVIPLPPEAKRPTIRGWPTVATTDPSAVRALFESHDGNVGLVLGGGVLAVDVDPRSGGNESLGSLLNGNELPETSVALTGGGGRHILLRYDPGLRVKNAVLARGIDLKADGGLVVVEPSTHPSGREYVWTSVPQRGIAPVPSWLWRPIECRCLVKEPCNANGEHHRIGTKRGQLSELTSEAIGRWPIERIGTRNDSMKRVVASFFRRGYDEESILETTTAWWEHFHAAGTIGTHPREAEAAVLATIGSLTRSRSFRIAPSAADHRARCSEIQLEDWQWGRLRGIVPRMTPEADPGTPFAPRTQPLIIRTHRVQALCRTEKERAFVEVLVVLCTHKSLLEPGPTIKTTDRQITEIAEDRRGVKLHPGEIERLKHRYISRPADRKPATRYGLLEEVVKGRRGKSGQPGAPSEYQKTGILWLLKAPEGPVSQAEGVQTVDSTSGPSGRVPGAS